MSKRVAALLAVIVVAVGGFLLFRPDKLVVDDRVDEDLASAFASAAPTTTVPNEVPETTTTVDAASSSDVTATTATTTTATESEPVAVAEGAFFGIDHDAAGTATIFEKDGTMVLRFEDDTDIQNGPDLFVWLVEGTNWDDPDNVVDLGKLKGNVGGQNYVLPADFDPDVHQNVLIWCLRFAVPFAAAELS